jgi:hypothetical protein
MFCNLLVRSISVPWSNQFSLVFQYFELYILNKCFLDLYWILSRPSYMFSYLPYFLYWLILWSRLLEIMTVAQLVKIFSALYGTPKVHYHVNKRLPLGVLLSHMKSAHSLSLRYIATFSHLHLGLLSGLFPSGFPSKTYMHFSFVPCVLHAVPVSSSLIWWL